MGRLLTRRQTSDLIKEYYSANFADQRRNVERFMAGHADVDWSINDPYVLEANDPDLAGYGAVLRYRQRFSTLYREGEVSRGLLQRFLGRELGFWNVRIFWVMAVRKDMYVRNPFIDLAYRISIGEGRSAFEQGSAMVAKRLLWSLANPNRGFRIRLLDDCPVSLLTSRPT